MRSLELKIPPVIVVLIAGALMWGISRGVPKLHVTVPARNIVATAIAVIGAAISLMGVMAFRRAGTTVNPLEPNFSSKLVASGIYKRTRNPMYLGFLLLLIGWGVWLSNALALVIIPIFIGYMNRFQILPEERALSSIFGQEFPAYKSKVGRWL